MVERLVAKTATRGQVRVRRREDMFRPDCARGGCSDSVCFGRLYVSTAQGRVGVRFLRFLLDGYEICDVLVLNFCACICAFCWK